MEDYINNSSEIKTNTSEVVNVDNFKHEIGKIISNNIKRVEDIKNI
jgi:hypothetical protein